MGRDDFDVIVVRCGISGLSAAITAQQNGPRIAILACPPEDERGCNLVIVPFETFKYTAGGSFLGVVNCLKLALWGSGRVEGLRARGRTYDVPPD